MTHAIIIFFLVWRFGLFIVSWISSLLIQFAPRFPYADIFLIPSGLQQWLWSFANFDGVHYITIATTGYSAQFTQVFFPLFPLIINFIRIIFPINAMVIGLIISNVFFLFSLFILVKLLELDYRKDTVINTVLILLVFPTSYYFGSLYTESLFLFLILSAFLAARKKHWFLSGLLGGFASATRFVGIFMLPALLWEWHISKLKTQNLKLKTTTQSSKVTRYFSFVLKILSDVFRSPVLYLIPLGLIAYMTYLYIEHNDPLYFWHVQPIFGAARSGTGMIFLPQVVFRYFKMFASVPLSDPSYFTVVLEFSALIIAITLLVIGHVKKIRLSYLIFSWLAIITPTLTGTLSSMPRYILVTFPIYIALALQIRTKLAKIAMIFIFMVFLIVLTMLFTSGRWVA